MVGRGWKDVAAAGAFAWQRSGAAVLGAIALALYLAAQPIHATPWQVQTIDDSGDAGWSVNLAVDHAGQPYALYYSGSQTLRDATIRDGNWTLGTPWSGTRSGLVLDYFQRPVRIYATAMTPSLYTIYGDQLDNAGNWAGLGSEVIEDAIGSQIGLAAGSLPLQVSVAAIRPHNQTIDLLGVGPMLSDPNLFATNHPIDVVIGSNDLLHLTWTSDSTIRYAAYDILRRELVHMESVVAAGSAPQIAYDRTTDTIHMAYPDSQGIHHAVYAEGVWSSEIVADRASGGRSLGGFVIDRHGTPHLSYIGTQTFGGSDNLFHAYLDDEGEWQRDSITSWANTVSGPETSDLAVDRAGGVHILFTDDDQQLRYAQRPGATTVTQAVAAVADVQVRHTESGLVYEDGGFDIGVERRDGVLHSARMEFDLGHLDETKPIVDARLLLEVNRITTSHQDELLVNAPEISAYAYRGDGNPISVDLDTAMRGMVGFSGQVLDTGLLEFILDPDLIEQMLAEDGTIGLMLGPGPNEQFAFWSSDAASLFNDLNGPTLEVTFIPEPASLALLGLGGLAMLMRRRPSGAIPSPPVGHQE